MKKIIVGITGMPASGKTTCAEYLRKKKGVTYVLGSKFIWEQLEKEGIDIFDLKLELKLATDKVKTGNFNMVQIYLDGLAPRVKKHWDKLGKEPNKLKKKLMSEQELKEAVEKAKKEREKAEAEAEKEEGEKSKGKSEEKKDPSELFKKDVAPDKILKLVNGMLVINLASLYDEIAAMKDDDYETHVNDEKNDFAKWVREAVGDKELAQHLELAGSKDEILELLDKRRNGEKLPNLDKEKANKLNQAKAVAEMSKETEEAEKSEEEEEKSEESPAEKETVSKEVENNEKLEVGHEEKKDKEGKAEEKEEEKKDEHNLEKKIERDEKNKKLSNGIEKSVEQGGEGREATEIKRTFKLENGNEISNLDQLRNEIKQMDDITFRHYVGEDYNRFADWIKDGLQKKELADKISNITDKNSLLEALENA